MLPGGPGLRGRGQDWWRVGRARPSECSIALVFPALPVYLPFMEASELLERVALHYESSPDLSRLSGPVRDAMIARRAGKALSIRSALASGDPALVERHRRFLVRTCPFAYGLFDPPGPDYGPPLP